MADRSLIELRDITKVYQMGEVEVHALRGVSLTIERGEWVAIMGPSGSGKSTLLHIMGCLDSPTTGSYVLNGTEVSGMNGDQLASLRNRELGFVFQSFNLLARTTALKQVMLPMQYLRNGKRFNGSSRRERAEQALAQVGLSERMDHQPTELSGGQQQRVPIARALINDPSIIMADEPTGNLDTKSGAEIMRLLRDLHEKQGITIVTVTHEPVIADQAERVISLLDGRISEDRRR